MEGECISGDDQEWLFIKRFVNFNFWQVQSIFCLQTILDILAKSRQIILFSKIFFSLTKMGIALMVWETFYNVKNGKQISLIPLKTWGCAQYPRWCECWNYFWLDPFFKSWPLGKLLAEMLQRVSISYKNSPAKDSDLKVKNKILWTFLHQIQQ